MIADQPTDLVEYSARLGKHVLAQASDLQRKQYGQFLTPQEAIGLSAILNCSVVDRYFRIVNGNTQVNAEELRALPLPPLAVVRQIGKFIKNEFQAGVISDIDAIVTTTLQEEGLLPPEFPIIRETRTNGDRYLAPVTE